MYGQFLMILLTIESSYFVTFDAVARWLYKVKPGIFWFENFKCFNQSFYLLHEMLTKLRSLVKKQ